MVAKVARKVPRADAGMDGHSEISLSSIERAFFLSMPLWNFQTESQAYICVSMLFLEHRYT